MEVFNLKIASEAVGVNEMAQQSKIGNEKGVSQVQNPGEQMPDEPEGGPVRAAGDGESRPGARSDGPRAEPRPALRPWAEKWAEG